MIQGVDICLLRFLKYPFHRLIVINLRGIPAYYRIDLLNGSGYAGIMWRYDLAAVGPVPANNVSLLVPGRVFMVLPIAERKIQYCSSSLRTDIMGSCEDERAKLLTVTVFGAAYQYTL